MWAKECPACSVEHGPTVHRYHVGQKCPARSVKKEMVNPEQSKAGSGHDLAWGLEKYEGVRKWHVADAMRTQEA